MNSKFDLSRRKFLTLMPSIASIAGLTLYPKSLLSQSSQTSDHFFCLLVMDGGWDVTLGLDPWIQEKRLDSKDIFIEYEHSELIGQGNIFLGPAASPLKNFSDRFCIINGVFMGLQDNGHPASKSYITTGNPTGTRPDLSVEVADARGPGPFGVISNLSVQTKESQTLTSTTDDIASLVNKDNPLEFYQFLFSLGQNTQTNWMQSLNMIIKGNSAYDNLRSDLKKMMDQYQIIKPEHVVASCFTSGACSEAQIELRSDSGNLDTHAQHVGNHIRIQKTLWEQVESVFNLFQKTPFKSTNLFEHTTFMVVSEFARTAVLNSAGGKDHNPLTNSVLLAGRGVRGQQIIGGSKVVTRQESETGQSYHIALPWDYKLQKVIHSSTEGSPHMIYPENVVRTLVEILKLNPNAFKSVAADKPYLPLAIL